MNPSPDPLPTTPNPAIAASYRVRLAKEQFVFCAAHFITYAGDVCEPLHGHNYRVEVQVEGPLDENHYVLDFIAVRDAVQKITLGLDHRVLLPTLHPQIRVAADQREVTATFEDRRWVFPLSDCVLLPIANTTAELLARWIGERLLESIHACSVEVSVDECDGQVGVCRLSHPR
ncbi:6-pyruvoyl tetrahydropterin synthase [Pirellulimonas nuda]|uniref:6-carboxy-5,6,7,8-tetrahydropterin synthase n=1 Tax=Pirellulimonas nuda TaxID=2528009 RepID=A0A518DJV4_9BACT|nr:6-pyruvoyl tetrahydropterin synthase family protein [Pirellulimonas nuda]QDU91764.1 6-pyruvoyl tetrahydropterin synthase [Pirellulimonas nuda]